MHHNTHFYRLFASKALFFLALLLLSNLSTGQECSSSQFSVKHNGEEYLTINSPTEVKTCGGINICTALNGVKQTLSLDADGSLQISEGNSVTLPDPSPTNEIQNLALNSAGDLSISGGNSVHLPDTSATNEIQQLSLANSGSAINLSQSGSSVDVNQLSCSDSVPAMCRRIKDLETTASKQKPLIVLKLKTTDNIQPGRISTWQIETMQGNITVGQNVNGVYYIIIKEDGLYQFGIYIPGYTRSDGYHAGYVSIDGVATFMEWQVYAPGGTYVFPSATAVWRVRAGNPIFAALTAGSSTGKISLLWGYKIAD